jgi:hypothetical protein
MPFDSLAGRPAALGRNWLPVVAVLAAAGLWLGGRSAAERMANPGGQGPLWVSESVLDEGRRLLVVIDQAGRHLAVYHVDAAAGTVTLKSTRDISWDLMVGDFNAQEPRPAALQKMLQLPAAAPR